MDITGYALIIGGGSGIGRACAVLLAREGAAGLLIADLNAKSAAQAAIECSAVSTAAGFRAEGVSIDVTSEDTINEATECMQKLFGRIDYCINCAGIGVTKPGEISNADFSEFSRFLKIHVEGTFLVTRRVSAIMKNQDPQTNGLESHGRGATRGTIVILGSASSFVASPSMVQYTTAKHAVLGLAKNAALDNAAHGIRVNCVCPSWVDTPMIQQARDGGMDIDAYVKSLVPLGRMAVPDEVADVVAFLCSPRSSYITGCGLIVDGGTTLSCHV